MKWLALICGFFSLLVCSCSNSVGVQAEKKPPVDVSSDTLAGMQRVQTLKSVTVLGTLESKAKVNERPKMKVRFDYDFSMGRHEVTCDEFNAVMENVSGLVLDCENDSLPATNLTFYDAVKCISHIRYAVFLLQFFRGSITDGLSLIQHDDTVAQIFSFFHIVSRVDNGLAPFLLLLHKLDYG